MRSDSVHCKPKPIPYVNLTCSRDRCQIIKLPFCLSYCDILSGQESLKNAAKAKIFRKINLNEIIIREASEQSRQQQKQHHHWQFGWLVLASVRSFISFNRHAESAKTMRIFNTLNHSLAHQLVNSHSYCHHHCHRHFQFLFSIFYFHMAR